MKKPILPILLGLAFAGQIFGAKVIPNHAVANLVLGQPDFVTNSVVLDSAFNLQYVTAVVIDPMTRKVFVCDGGNNRVLRYPSADALTNGAGAEAVFGQSRFSSSSSDGGDLGLNSPRDLFFDRKGRLWVADRFNHRVLMYEAASFRSSNSYPDKVLGQPDFSTTTSGTTSSKMNLPCGLWVDADDRLWVAEYSNNRVLRFDSVSSKSNGAAADGVLGQSIFTSGGSGSGAAGMSGPEGVAISSTGALFVAIPNQNRVLRFDSAATLANGANATRVLGQLDFTGTSSGLSATALHGPYGLTLSADDSLWVADYFNNRVVRFDNASSLLSGAKATGVVGQPDFVTSAAATTNRGLSGVFLQPCVDATGSLWVPDTNNNRVLRFPPDVTKPLLTLTGTPPKKTTKKNVTIKGTASDAYGISKVQYRIGTGAVKTASGTTSWQFTGALKKGKNTITIIATDSVGNVSLSKVVKIKRS